MCFPSSSTCLCSSRPVRLLEEVMITFSQERFIFSSLSSGVNLFVGCSSITIQSGHTFLLTHSSLCSSPVHLNGLPLFNLFSTLLSSCVYCIILIACGSSFLPGKITFEGRKSGFWVLIIFYNLESKGLDFVFSHEEQLFMDIFVFLGQNGLP